LILGRVASTLGVEMQAIPLNHVSAQMYVCDPAGNLFEVDWPDVTTLDRSLMPEIKRLADSIPQTGDTLRATLYLAKAEL